MPFLVLCALFQNLLIDSYCWYCLFLNYLYLVTLMNFEGVLCIYVLLLHEGQAECHYDMFSICETNKRLSMHCYSWIFVCILSCCNNSCYVLLLELLLSCSCLEFFDPSFNACKWLDLYCEGACHLKNYSFITYLLEDEQELSLGMLIRRKRIYNFWCSMLV